MKLMDVTLFKNEPMQYAGIRLPAHLREKARQLAKEKSTGEKTFTESDVYRTAITLFLNQNFTDSKEREGGDTDQN